MKVRQFSTAFSILKEQGLRGFAQVLLQKLAQATPNSSLPRVKTEFMVWLKYANAGMLGNGNIDCFDYAMKHLPSEAPLVEIGSFCGLSTNMITHCKAKHKVKNKLFSCDKWFYETERKDGKLGVETDISLSEYREFVKSSFLTNVNFFSREDLPHSLELFSDDFFEAWENKEKRTDIFDQKCQLGGPISFCYIDGNHSYDFAKRDFEHCDKYLEQGGFILFDDSFDGSGWGVCKVVKEVIATQRYELVAQNPNYFFKKK